MTKSTRVQVTLFLTDEQIAQLKREAEEWTAEFGRGATWREVLHGIAQHAVNNRLEQAAKA